MLIANTTVRDSLPLTPRRRTVSSGAPAVQARAAFGLAWLRLVLQVWRERRALARLTDAEQRDIGLHASTVSREVDRSVFDLPRARVDALHGPERHRCSR